MALASTDLTSAAVASSLRGRRADLPGLAFQGALLASMFATVLILCTLLISVVQDASPILTGEPLRTEVRPDRVDTTTDPPTVTRFGETSPVEVDVRPDGTPVYFESNDRSFGEFLGNDVNFTEPASNGIRQGIIGSLGIALMVLLFAIPIGVGAAIYLEEYATTSRFTRFVDVNIRNLAGVPSIVYGILGFTVLVTALSGITGGRSLISGGITLAVLVLPIVIITSAEALRAVPQPLREAGFGVGATRWEVVRHHVLPYALPGILTGVMLSLARALGEAAPLILVGAQTGFFTDPAGALERLTGNFTALPMLVFNFTRQPGAALSTQGAAATIVVLLLVVLLVNASGILLRNSFEKKRS